MIVGRKAAGLAPGLATGRAHAEPMLGRTEDLVAERGLHAHQGPHTIVVHRFDRLVPVTREHGIAGADVADRYDTAVGHDRGLVVEALDCAGGRVGTADEADRSARGTAALEVLASTNGSPRG